MRDRRRVILDTDPGIDDALAILLALRSPELEIVAFTTVCGNVPVEQATRNLLRVISLMTSPSTFPIGQGAAHPLVWPLETAIEFHGSDGLGELDRFSNTDGSPRYPEPDHPRILPTAQQVWKECVRRYPGELTLITLGPLTNLAQVLETDPSTARGLQAVICMGGAVTVPGNITPSAEFNIWVDPHAAQRVLTSGLPIALVPLDVTNHIALSREELRALTANAGVIPQFVGDATARALDSMQRREGRAVFHLHDPLAATVAIAPEIIHLTPMRITVETDRPVTRGITVADRRGLKDAHKSSPPIQVALTVDAKRALRVMQDRLCRT